MHIDTERYRALVELLALPDEPHIRRGHHLTVPGSDERFQLLPILASAYVQAKLLEMREREARESAH